MADQDRGKHRTHQRRRNREQELAAADVAEADSGLFAGWGLKIWGGVAALVVLHVALATAAAWNKCATFDEASHLANGYSIWKTGDYRMYPVGLATQRWMTLPLLAAGVPGPATDTDMWHHSHNWTYGNQILYESGFDGMSLLRACRFMVSLLSAALAVLTFAWARKLFGTAGGFTALVLYALNPTVLAHGAVTTLDTGAALAILAAMTSLWCVLQRLTYGRLALSAAVWGLAFCAKFSTLLIIPMGLIVAAVRIFDGKPWSVRLGFPKSVSGVQAKGSYTALVIGAHVVGAWLVIWGVFGFQFNTFREYSNDLKQIYTGPFEVVAAQAPRYTGLLQFARGNRLLPEAFLYCFADTVRTTEGRVSYLDGWFGIYGFKSFFPLAFAYKTPLAVFGFMVLALGAHAARRMHQMKVEQRRPLDLLWEGIYAVLPLVVILVVYGCTAILSGMNIGIRHILPMFGPLFILCGLAGEWITAALRRFDRASVSREAEEEAVPSAVEGGVVVPSEIAPPAGWPSLPDAGLRVMFGAVVLMFVVLIGEVGATFPNYLAYFNTASGGISEGHRHLVDSSLDWGQDLPALRQWLEQQGIGVGDDKTRVYLSYFGATPPSSAGFRIRRQAQDGLTLLPSFFERQRLEPNLQQPFELGLSNGVFCISATMLQALYLTPYNGPWIASYDARYRQVLRDVHYFENLKKDPERYAKEMRENLTGWLMVADEFDRVRFGRLLAYLRTREPLHIVNGSILVYRLSDQDLIAALDPRDLSRVRPDPPTLETPREY